MKIYHYSESTGALTGTGFADADPLNPGGWLLPAWATVLAPPPSRPGWLTFFDFSEQKWKQKKISEVTL
jgi:hypothetical protein